MKAEKRKSKGMRKHLRRKKAEDKKKEFRIQRDKQSISNLPNYENFPRRIKGPYYWQCPHCHAGQYNAQKKTINMQQGNREIFECEDCKKYYRP